MPMTHFKVLLNVLPKLSLSNCNKLIGESWKWYKETDFVEDISAHTNMLNETLNKFTDEEYSEQPQNKDPLHLLKTCCLIEPFQVVQELVKRVLLGNFKLSVLKRVRMNQLCC